MTITFIRYKLLSLFNHIRKYFLKLSYAVLETNNFLKMLFTQVEKT